MKSALADAAPPFPLPSPGQNERQAFLTETWHEAPATSLSSVCHRMPSSGETNPHMASTWSRMEIIKGDNSLGNHVICQGGSTWASQCLCCGTGYVVCVLTGCPLLVRPSRHGLLGGGLQTRHQHLHLLTMCPVPSLECPNLSSILGRTGTWVHTQGRCSSPKESKYVTTKVLLSPFSFQRLQSHLPFEQTRPARSQTQMLLQ